ncbi:MAG: amidohydrolase family protein, partial [Longicatena sp.]
NTTSHLQVCNFCISSSHEQVSLQSQMMAAQLLAMKDHINAYELLKAVTINPARFLKREDLGVLDIGKCANIILLSVKDIHSFFYSLDQNCISQIIHKGVRIYPNLLI